MIGYDHAPLGDVAFRTTPAELYTSGSELRKIAVGTEDDGARDVLLATAQWYEDLALDLAEIQSLDETDESPFQAVQRLSIDPDSDIPF